MKTSRPRTVLTAPEAKAELRLRILEIVDREFHLSDYEVWRASAPNYLPWRAMINEITALDKDKKLRLEIIGPGNLVVHSLKAEPAEALLSTTEAAKKAKPRK